MLLLVLASVICGALAAPTPQLEALNPQPGADTRFVPLVVQVPEAASGTFVPVVVSAPADLTQESQQGNSSAVVFLVDNSQAEISALLNGTTTETDASPAVTEATEVFDEVTVETEQATDVPAILVDEISQDEVVASVDPIETVRQQAEAIIAKDVAEVVAIVEAEEKAEAQLEETISEAIAVERVIEVSDSESVTLLVQESDGSVPKIETIEEIAPEKAIDIIDQAVVEQVQETVATEKAGEVAIEEKIADIELTIETEQKIETTILGQVNEASVIDETVESVNRKGDLEELSTNEVSGKSLLQSTNTHNEAVEINEEEPQNLLPNALSAVMDMVLNAAQEVIGTTTSATEQEVSGVEVNEQNTEATETPAVQISEVIPAIGGIIEVTSENTQEETERTASEDTTESSTPNDPNEVVLEQKVTESVSETLAEAEQTVLAVEEIFSTTGESVIDADSINVQEQAIVQLEPVVTVLDDVVVRGKAISDGQIVTSQVIEEVIDVESPVSVVEAIVDSRIAGEEIVVAEESVAATQEEVSVGDLSNSNLQEVLSEQAPGTSGVVIIPQELAESIQEEISGPSSANQAKEITVVDVIEEGSLTSVSSANDNSPIEIALGSASPVVDVETETVSETVVADTQSSSVAKVLVEVSEPEVTVTASEVAPVESNAVIETSAPVESVAAVDSSAPVESVTAVETSAPVESVVVVETSEPIESVAAVETSAPVESVAIVETSAPVESVAVVESSALAKSQTAAEEAPAVVSESVSTSQVINEVSQSVVTQSKQVPAPAQQNLLVGNNGRVIFGTSTFGSSVSPANFIIGQPVRVPQQVAIDLAARSARPTGTDQARTIVGPRFQQFIFDNDSPDVVAAKVNFFRARAASLGAPLGLTVQPTPAAAAPAAAAPTAAATAAAVPAAAAATPADADLSVAA